MFTTTFTTTFNRNSMKPARILAKALLLVAIGWNTPLMALGLGKVELKSVLGENLSITIPILGDEEYDDGQLLIGQAPQAMYERMQVAYQPALSKLRFSISRENPKAPVIIVKGHQPVNEPYVDFIIELKSPTGVVYKQVTVMLETPSRK